VYEAGYIDSENLAYSSRRRQGWVDSNTTLGKLFQGWTLWWVGGSSVVVMPVVEAVVTLRWWCDYRPSADVERRRGCAIRFLAVSRGFFFLYCRKFNQACVFAEHLLINYVSPVRKKNGWTQCIHVFAKLRSFCLVFLWEIWLQIFYRM